MLCRADARTADYDVRPCFPVNSGPYTHIILTGAGLSVCLEIPRTKSVRSVDNLLAEKRLSRTMLAATPAV